MIVFRERTLLERVKRLWPPYRRRRDAAMLAALKQLCANPEMPCQIGPHHIPNGYMGMVGGPK